MNQQTPTGSSSLEAESAFLGTVMFAPDTVYLAEDINPQDFSDLINRYLWKVLRDLHRDSKDITDRILVLDALRAGGVECEGGWPIKLVDLCKIIPNSSGFEGYCSIIKRESFRRKALSAVTRLSHDLPTSDPLEAVEAFHSSLNSESSDNRMKPALTMKQVAAEASNISKREESQTWQTGYYELDRLLGDMIGETSFTVIAAGPSFGKSALALNLAMRAHNNGTPVRCLYICMEMSEVELFDRMTSATAQIQTQVTRKLRLQKASAKLEEQFRDHYSNTTKELSETGHIIKADGLVDINDVKALVAKHHREVDMVVIDYLQQLKPTSQGQKTLDRVNEASGACKDMATKYKTPIIALAQLNRDGYKEGRKPDLSHLKESGQIEQDADNVWLLWREKKEGVPEEEIELFAAKTRGGAIARINLNFELTYGRITNLKPKRETDNGRF